jgi:AcrR family transcriptional regulator
MEVAMARQDARGVQRRRIDRGQVLDAAETIVDEQGWDRLTMAGLAGALGIKVPSLYNHVEGLDELRGELQVRTMRGLADELSSAAMGRAGEEGIRALARAHRDFARRHPHRYEGLTREPIDREAFAEAAAVANGAMLAVLRDFELDEAATLQVELAMFAGLHGAVTLEISGFYGDVVDPDALFETVVSAAIATLDGATRKAA